MQFNSISRQMKPSIIVALDNLSFFVGGVGDGDALLNILPLENSLHKKNIYSHYLGIYWVCIRNVLNPG